MEASQIFQAFKNLNVIIVGDVMIDRYLEGKVERISPEAPVPVVQMRSSENRLGGAANVALNIKALGATPHLVSVIGDDENGEILMDLLPKSGLHNRGIVISKHRPTTVKTRVLAGSQQLLRVDREIKDDLNKEEQQDLLDRIRLKLEQQKIDVIIFQDYNKGVLSKQVIHEVLLEAIRRDIPTAVDPKQHNFWTYKRATLFKPNLREIQQQMDTDLAAERPDLDRAADLVEAKLGNVLTLITLSEKGLYLRTDQDAQIYPTRSRSIADVCGAGDTVISVAALALALGLPNDQLAELANLAGGQVCERVGVVPVDLEQLAQEFAEEASPSPRN